MSRGLPLRKSSFIYGFDIDESNKYFYFDVGGTQYTAELNVGNYTMTTMGSELSRAMNEVSAEGYTVTVDRPNRFYTITSPTAFSILGDSVSTKHCNALLGFATEASAEATSHTSESSAGKVFTPALPLFDYASFEDSQDAGDATVTESSAGTAEIVTTGIVQEMECNIRYITNLAAGGEYFDQTGGKDAANEFMKYVTAKKKVEFCEDSEDLDAYTPCILASTKRSKQGVGYRLQRVRGLYDFFETGMLVFRKLEL